MQVRAHRAGRKIQPLGDLAMGPSLHIVQQNHFPPVLRKVCKRRQQPLAKVRPLRRGGRRLAWVSHRVGGERRGPADPLVPQQVAGPPPHDLPEPGAEPGRVPAVVDPVTSRISRQAKKR